MTTLTDPVFFTVLADETTDISCQEQISLCARFVGDGFSVEEYFLKFVPVTDLSGKELASTVLKNLLLAKDRHFSLGNV